MAKIRVEAQVTDLQGLLLKLTEFLENWKTDAGFVNVNGENEREIWENFLSLIDGLENEAQGISDQISGQEPYMGMEPGLE